MTLRAGASVAVMTPPVGYPMRATGAPALGIDDDLTTRCLMLEDAHGRTALVTLDVGSIEAEMREAIEKRVRQTLDGAIDDVMVCETGNGCSPMLEADSGGSGIVARYCAYLPDVVAGNALRASLAMRDVAAGATDVRVPNIASFADGSSLGSKRTEAELRRLEAAPLLALQDADDRLVAVVVGSACPPVVRAPDGRWTADYPGVLCWMLEQSGVETAMFVSADSKGIAPFDWWEGNPSPSHQSRSNADAHALGLIVATQVAQAIPRIVPRRNVRRAELLEPFAVASDGNPPASANRESAADVDAIPGDADRSIASVAAGP